MIPIIAFIDYDDAVLVAHLHLSSFDSHALLFLFVVKAGNFVSFSYNQSKGCYIFQFPSDRIMMKS